MEKELMVNKYIADIFKDIEITDDNIKSYYEENKNSFNKVKASHILVKTKGKADELYQKAKAGTDFAELAKNNSTGPSATKGGDLGWFGKGMMVKSFENVAFALAKEEISKPVKTDFGWHIIKCTDKTTITSYRDVATEIRNTLVTERKKNAIETRYKKLQDNYKVKIIEK